MAEQPFEQFAAAAERQAIAAQVEANSVSFIEHQARAWSEIQKWWAESLEFGKPPETANGPGSTVEATEDIRTWLPQIFTRYNITTMLDAPCGDGNWMNLVPLDTIEYTGWDADQRVLDKFRTDVNPLLDVLLERINILTVPEIPAYDLILCRDFLAHLPNNLIATVLDKFTMSGSKYLLVSNYPDADNDFVYKPQDWTYFGYAERPVNLETAPFSLGKKIDSHPEAAGPGGVISNPHELALFDLR